MKSGATDGLSRQLTEPFYPCHEPDGEKIFEETLA